MDKEIKEILSQLGQKLDTVTALLLRLVPRNIDGLSLKDQIKFLDGLDVRPVDIARIVGKKSSHVSKELVSIRRGK